MEQSDECFDTLEFAVDFDQLSININKDDKVYISKNLINQANGSSYIELASVKVTCAIYGLHEIILSTHEFYSKFLLKTSIKFARYYSINALMIQYDNDEDFEEALLPSILLHIYPKSEIGGQYLLPDIVALIDACIELYDTIIAKSLKINQSKFALCYTPKHLAEFLNFFNSKNKIEDFGELENLHLMMYKSNWFIFYFKNFPYMNYKLVLANV